LPKYQLDIPHTLAPEEAKKRIDEATGKLSSDYGATCTWKTDTELAVSRKGLDARVVLEPSKVRIDLNLGFLMTPFAGLPSSGASSETGVTCARAARSASQRASFSIVPKQQSQSGIEMLKLVQRIRFSR